MDGSDTSANTESFRLRWNYWSKRGCGLFPEGTSIGGRKLLNFKTGAARIAFQAEEEWFNLGLVLQPVGITTLTRHFKSSVSISVGEPIEVRKYFRELPLKPGRDCEGVDKELEEASVALLSKFLIQVIDSSFKKSQNLWTQESDFEKLRI